MREIRFAELDECLRTGREIEFAYNGRHYSITTNVYWYFCRDDEEGSVILERVCPHRELDYLAARMADTTIDGVTIRRIFDEMLYAPETLCIW